jgi:hypothetical protein
VARKTAATNKRAAGAKTSTARGGAGSKKASRRS